MKKLSLILMALLLCLALVACGGDGDDTTLPGNDTVDTGNTGNDPVVVPECSVHTNKILEAVPSTCTQTGLEEGSACAVCGKVLIAQKDSPLAPHKYKNGSCTVCSKALEASTDLKMSLNDKGEYVVDGIGKCTDVQLVIPSENKGKPVVAISARAFSDNNDIVQVVIPGSVKRIGDNAFNGCENLASIVLEEGIEHIGEKAFMYCIGLKSVVIPDSVTTIYSGAFMACYELVEATLGAGLTKINNDVFALCYNLEVVDILSKISSVGDWAFFECDLLSTINYEGTGAEWNALEFGHRWDENEGAYNVFCLNGETVHKHVYGELFETGAPCELGRKCTTCNVIQKSYEHGDISATASWAFTSEGVISTCTKCGKVVDNYVKSDVILQLDFNRTVASELAAYPYFTLVSDKATTYETDGDRSVWAVNNVTWLDYDKRAFTDLKYYSITFDLKFDGDPQENLRDISVISFIPGYKNGAQVGSRVEWNYQIKYIPLLGKLSTTAVNGQTIPYKTVESVPGDIMPNDSNSVDFPVNTWVTVNVVCDVNAKISYIFVDGKPIGTRPTFDYGDVAYNDAYSFRFCDFGRNGIKFDNVKIQAMTAE